MNLQTSLRPMTPVLGRFARAQEEVCAFVKRTSGKILLVSDGSGAAELAPASVLPRTALAVFDGDALPLFAMPDAGGVIAAGGKGVMLASRYLADITGVPLLLLPTDAAFEGVYEGSGEVSLGGKKYTVSFKRGDVVWDSRLLKASVPRAYAAIALCSLGLFERRALARLGEGEYGGAEERAYAALSRKAEDETAIISLSAELAAGQLPVCEGRIFAAALGGELPEFTAYISLLSLYLAFFRFGKPLRYTAVDYQKRAERAGVPYSSLRIPSPEQLARRAVRLERVRRQCVLELEAEKRRAEEHTTRLRLLGGRPQERGEKAESLPERAPAGLCALIRDFGLMEDG